MVIGNTPPATLTGIAENDVPSEPEASIREPSSGNWIWGACSLPVRTNSPSGRNRRSGSGNLALLAISTPLGGFGSGIGSFPVRAKASNRIGAAAVRPDQPWNRGAVGTPDPDPDGHAAVEADRPGVTVAIAGAGLECDPVLRSILRRRRSHQDISDLPGRDLIHQPQRLARLILVGDDLAQWPRGAEPRNPRVELHQILQRHADAAESHRQSRHFVLRQHQVAAGLFSRDDNRLAPTRSNSAIAGTLRESCNALRTGTVP